ncbi:hypothetical protein GCM10009634_12140 [Saccharothrix xinjiangensis]
MCVCVVVHATAWGITGGLAFVIRVNEGACRVTRRARARLPLPRDADGDRSVNVKKVVTLAAVALVLFLLITQPNESAEAVRTALGWLEQGAQSIITFVRSLFA